MPSAPTPIVAQPTSDDPNQTQGGDVGHVASGPVTLPAGTVGGNAYGGPAVGSGAASTAKQAGGSPFVSFNDYLNANAGALQTERDSSLAAGQASLDKLGADVKPMQDAAYQQGQAAGQAGWSAQRAAGNTPGGTKVTSSEQYKAPADFSVNFSGLPGQEQYAKDSAKAQSDIAAIGQGGLGMGKSAFEAGMIGADQSYKQGAAGLQKQYQDSVNSYLDSIKASGAAGLASFQPKPIAGFQTQYDPATSGSGSPNEGPVGKPQHKRVKTINGKPVAGEEP